MKLSFCHLPYFKNLKIYNVESFQNGHHCCKNFCPPYINQLQWTTVRFIELPALDHARLREIPLQNNSIRTFCTGTSNKPFADNNYIITRRQLSNVFPQSKIETIRQASTRLPIHCIFTKGNIFFFFIYFILVLCLFVVCLYFSIKTIR